MEGYPHDLAAFEARFATEEACRDYLMRIRWPDGFRCPGCGHGRAWPVRKVWLECARCGRQTSATAGTIFQDTRKPLRQWFAAMWLVAAERNGISARELQLLLRLGSYQTAWTWLHKLRRAMVTPGQRLSGEVEIDQTGWDGRKASLSGRQNDDKALLAVAVEAKGARMGSIRVSLLRDASAASLVAFVEASVDPRGVLHVNSRMDHEVRKRLERKGYFVSQEDEPEQESKLLPRAHKTISMLNSWIRRARLGAISLEHLGYYLDEFTFRFNRRNASSRGKLFYQLMQQAVKEEPTPYRSIVANPEDKPTHRSGNSPPGVGSAASIASASPSGLRTVQAP